MLVLRADPWNPEYGMGFDVGLEEAAAPLADPFVETEDWSRPVAADSLRPACPTWFVDGVRRVELRLVADEDGRRVPGLFGSYAVGSVRCDGRAVFAGHRVCRAIVLGGGVMPPPVRIAIGHHQLAFEPASDPGSDQDRPLWRLQQLMRAAEAPMAAHAADEEGCVVLVDGPLTFRDPTHAPVVGVVKRLSRQYLGAEQEALVGRLGRAERTPLFGLGTEDQPLQRYAWYARLCDLRVPWHDHSGIVRCEVRSGVGLERAIELAERVTALLPSFAGRTGDPRAPQNLVPVAGLESWLRHRMGDRSLVRRSLVAWLASGEAA